MKKYFYIGMLCVLFSLMIGCVSDKKQKSVDKQEIIDRGEDLNETESKISVRFSDEKISEAYESYLLIKAAMVNSDSKSVQIEAKKLEDISSDLSNVKELRAVSKLIALTNEIKKQRDFFTTLTTEFEKLIKRKTIKSGEIYKQFCPMAFNGEGGYWLSDSRQIRNPYFGKEMLACGSVKEVIK